ncbi:adenylyltransferase [archaeon SCG-AAA382B04]|nr:adenylyltransferase [archaeon SCG-AAA382B04]
MMNLSDKEKRYYSRQLPILKEKGQKKLKNKTVLIGGIGGIGSSAALSLARMGVGEIIIVDDDKVDLSNLNRQQLYSENDVGKPKTKIAKQKLEKINSNIDIKLINKKIDQNNIPHILDESIDAFIDGFDNIETRYVVNKRCMEKKIPYIHASCEGMEGRITLIIPNETPCLHCIYQGKKPRQKEPIPVMGFLPNKLGVMEAEQFYRFTFNLKTLKNKILIFSKDKMEPSILKIEKNKNCEICQET